MQGCKRAVGLAVAAAILIAAPARAADYFVTTTTDVDAACFTTTCATIRSAFAAISQQPAGPNTVHVPAGETQLSSVLSPPTGVSIVGAGARPTIIKAPANDRVFDVNGENAVMFVGLTMSGGVEPGTDTSGGGTLHVGSTAIVALDHVRVTGGSASVGGGIMNDGARSLTISKSLIDGNHAAGPGGGIESQGNAFLNTELTLTDTTVTGNSASTAAGVDLIQNGAATTRIQRVTIAGNSAAGSGGGLNVGDAGSVVVSGSIVASNPGGDCSGTVQPTNAGGNLESGTSCGFALQNADPQLGPLSDQGGQTPVLPLPDGSPAVDIAGACGPATDQRDIARPQGAACDAGAFELVPAVQPPPTPT